MDILSIGKTLHYNNINITTITEAELSTHPQIEKYDYIMIHGGDGTIRRVCKTLHLLKTPPPLILNPIGSFNVVAKLHNVPDISEILEQLSNHKIPSTQTQQIYSLNNEIFLFSAGNMGDLQHIFLSETLRFGFLKRGIAKYLLAVVFLFPVHLVMTPFMLMSKRKFFIFTPLHIIKKFGSFYGKIEEIEIDLQNKYNMIELDGDIVTIEESLLHIKPQQKLHIVTREKNE